MLPPVNMHRQGIRSLRVRSLRLARSVAFVLAAAVCLLSMAALALAEQASVPLPGKTNGWTQVIKAGFTDPNNSYAASFAKYKGYLYLSTIANKSGTPYSGSDKMGGDILRSEDGVSWEQLGEPGLGNPRNSTFRFMVFKDKLYAISDNLNDHGLEIWVTSDGSKFTQIEEGGFGDKDSMTAQPLVFNGRLILGVNNSTTGAQIWVSDDGKSFRQVVAGGMGGKNNSAISTLAAADDPALVFKGNLYVGAANLQEGGEIWRTADGLEWERVAAKGLERSGNILLTPCLVFQDQLYAVGWDGDPDVEGIEVYRTSDGTTWEKVVSDGFGLGGERNVLGALAEYKGELYLTTNTWDPRILNPDQPSERVAPEGFQLYKSTDGKEWTQVGEDGFGADSSIMAYMAVFGEDAYLGVYDYRLGNQLWRSSDGTNWNLMFQAPVPSWFDEGGGPIEFQGHLFWSDNDLKRGFELWRTDEVVVADATTTTLTSDTTGGTTVTSLGGSTTTVTEGGGTGGSGDDSQGGGKSEEGAGSESRIAAFVVGAIAILLGLVFQGINVSFLVGLAFAVAASANLPCIIMMLFWEAHDLERDDRVDHRGHRLGRGDHSLLPHRVGTLRARPGRRSHPTKNPGIISIPAELHHHLPGVEAHEAGPDGREAGDAEDAGGSRSGRCADQQELADHLIAANEKAAGRISRPYSSPFSRDLSPSDSLTGELLSLRRRPSPGRDSPCNPRWRDRRPGRRTGPARG